MSSFELIREFPFGGALRGRTLRSKRNGLTVHHLHDPTAPVIAFQTWYRCGSRDEIEGKTGVAHLLEHLMFGATRDYAIGEFDRRMEEAGAETNAATSTDFTYYYENLPREAFEDALMLEASRMRRLIIGRQEIETEREVVENERRLYIDDDVEGRSVEHLYALAFREHGYKHPTLGWLEDIRGLRAKDCLEFYRRFYAPNNASLIVVGDIEEDEALALIERSHGALRPSQESARIVRTEPPQRAERRETLRMETASERLEIGYRCVGMGHRDYPAFELLLQLIASSRSAPLRDSLIHRRELCLELSASATPFEEEGLIEFGISCRPGVSAEDTLAAFDEELDAALSRGFKQASIDRALNRLEFQLYNDLDTALGKADTLGFYDVILGKPEAAFTLFERARRFTPEQLRAIAKRYLRPSRRSVIIVKAQSGAADVGGAAEVGGVAEVSG